MKAAWFEEFGSAAQCLVLGELPQPEAGAGEVLVKVMTTGVNPSDVKKRAGAFPNLLDDGLVIPHSDGAGVIEAVGSGVSAERVGERVWLYQAQYGRRFGTAADESDHLQGVDLVAEQLGQLDFALCRRAETRSACSRRHGCAEHAIVNVPEEQCTPRTD